MRYFLLIVLTLIAQFSDATTYYFSSLTGDDNRSSDAAQSPATPWRTLEKLATIMPILAPGDSVLLKRGESFGGNLNITASGLTGSAIYFGGYGNGANPVITGLVPLSDWTLYSPGIYSTPLDANRPNIITIDGQAKSMGRYPNTGYLAYETHVNNQSITDNELPATPSWSGAEIVIRKLRFILDRHFVTSHDGTTLTYSTSTDNGNNSAYNPVDRNGYFFQNSLQTLDLFGEWYYDPAAKLLYVFFGENPPANYSVKASTMDENVRASQVHDLVFDQLDFEGANKNGLNVLNASNVLVKNCNFRNQGGRSLYGIDVSGVTVQGGSVNTSFSNGIFFEYNAHNVTVDGVSVTNTNTIAGTGRSGDAVGIGIKVYGNDAVIINNRVVATGYSGIQFTGNNVLVEKNLVDGFCLVKDDGGGIYTYNGSPNVSNENRKVKNNIVLNGIGAYAGAEAYSYEAFGKAAGIYLDEYASNVEVVGNTIANGDWAGMMLHNAPANTIRSNTVYNYRYQVHVGQYMAATRNYGMSDNQYIARQTDQNTFFYRSYVEDSPATMGTLDNNYYARPLNDNATIRFDKYWTGGGGMTNLTLTQWQSMFSLDQNSKKSPLTFATNTADNFRFEYNDGNTVKIINLPASYVDVKNNQYAGSIGLDPFTSVVLLKSPVNFLPNQVITFPPIADKIYGDVAFNPGATSTSGLPVSYRVVSGPATASGSSITITGVGAVNIEASQAGNAAYKPAKPVTQSFTVAMANQAINFAPLANKTFGNAAFTVSATATSGLPVTFRVASGPAKISGNTVSLTGAGTVSIEASQPGNTNYNAATPVERSFTVAKAAQTISFAAIPDKTFGTQPFTINVSASSTLGVTLTVSGPATISGNTVTLTGAGQVKIVASQEGNENYNAASPVERSFAVAKANQTITFPSIPNKTANSAPFALTASASSKLTVSYSVVSGPAKVSGNIVSLTGTGKVTIKAMQAGDLNYNAANPVQQSFTVSKSSGGASTMASLAGSQLMEVSLATLEPELSVHPNPLRNSGVIRVALPQTAEGSLSLYNSDGQLVKQWGKQQLKKGSTLQIQFDASSLSKGTYFLQLLTDAEKLVRVVTVQ